MLREYPEHQSESCWPAQALLNIPSRRGLFAYRRCSCSAQLPVVLRNVPAQILQSVVVEAGHFFYVSKRDGMVDTVAQRD
jgi:hypothetical protein